MREQAPGLCSPTPGAGRALHTLGATGRGSQVLRTGPSPGSRVALPPARLPPPFPLTALMDRQLRPARNPPAPTQAPLPPLLRREPGPRQRRVLPPALAGCASHRELAPWAQQRRLAGTVASSTAPPGCATSRRTALGSSCPHRDRAGAAASPSNRARRAAPAQRCRCREGGGARGGHCSR